MSALADELSTDPPAAVLSGLDPEQRRVVLAPVGPVCVLAGAGTGKTRAITRRVAYQVLTGQLPAGQVLTVTFTARAAGELRTRLRQLGAEGVQARTFHAAALRQLGYFWPQVIGGPLPQLVSSKARLVAQAARAARVTLQGPALRDVTSEIEWAKATMVGPADYPAAATRAARDLPLDASATAGIYTAYEEVKRQAGMIDFEDLLLLMAGLIEEHKFVADELHARYRHFVVDEFQDVNPLQHRLLTAWLGKRSSLCVVGDPEQTIYSFTGASSNYLQTFRQRHEDAEIVRLVRNYRSSPQVVGLANAVIGRAGKTGALEAQSEAGPEPSWLIAEDEAEEAQLVAGRIAELIRTGTPASEIAILVRINAQSEAYEEALTRAKVAYILRGGERFFERPEVREAMVRLRGAARAEEDVGAPDLLTSVSAVLATAGWRADEPPSGVGAQRERWENVAALVRLAQEAQSEAEDAGAPAPTLSTFTTELAERAAAQHVPTVEGVTLASLHAAKGLEWDAVFLVGLVDGTLPITYAVTPEALAEERRLLYVGVTRARRQLTLSWAKAREAGRRPRKPSRFLTGIGPETEARSKPSRSKRGGVPAAVDPQLWEALRQWRSERAAEQKQPAFCVFTDATLEAIASNRPANLQQLRKLPGVGATKLERFGPGVLEVLESLSSGAGSAGKTPAK
ncbi:MAG TPA: ATP-dependent DNA helicase UvrD2 [Frankiaceae bacterium]|nr:ATP-dependent DNA helicase UvrD2 [Frankiaceae bacterium]